MNAPPNLSKIEQLRARDGDKCWLCDGRLAFNAEPNSKKAPTKEHLDALSNGGSDMLDNLVLCHPGCNRHLANRPKADKLKMRDTRMATRARQLSVHPISKPPAPAKSGHLPSQSSRSLKPSPDRTRLVAAIDRWRRIALGSAAVALFALGLSLGLLVAR